MESLTYNRVADQKRLAFIIENIQKSVPSGGSILDVGCGNGIISLALGKLDYHIFGIDASEKAIQKAKSFNRLDNVRFEVVNAEELVIENMAYDAIICSEVLEHLTNPSELLQTLHHLLKPTGVLVVTVPNGQGPREVLVTKPTLKLRKECALPWKVISTIKGLLGYKGNTVQSDADNLDHVQFFSKRQLYELSNRHNFTIKVLKNTNFMDDVFPFSLLTRRFIALQKLDCLLADKLPDSLTGGFVMVWTKKE